MHLPSGYEMDDARKIGAGLKVPRMAAGRFCDARRCRAGAGVREAEMVNLVRASTRSRTDPQITLVEVPCIGATRLPWAAPSWQPPGVHGRNRQRGARTDVVGGSDRAACAQSLHRRRRTQEAWRLHAAALWWPQSCPGRGYPSGGTLNCSRCLLQALGDIGIWLVLKIYRPGVDVRLSTWRRSRRDRGRNPDVVIVDRSYPADGLIAQGGAK